MMYLNNKEHFTSLENKVKSVNFHVGEAYEDDTPKILNIITENKDAVCLILEDEGASQE